jgi:predicted GH43/DUF377 family glycosyl hydrolase
VKIKQVKPEDIVGPLTSSPIIKRHPQNPIFTAKDVPYPSVIAYDAEVVKYERKYGIVFRNDYHDKVKIYYAAADIVECLAIVQLDELIDFCLSFK